MVEGKRPSVKPLDGIRVLDFSTLLPGPMASLMLQREGAVVTKIERPGGEDMRSFPPRPEGRRVLYDYLNKDKQIIEIDLKSPDALTRLLPLVQACDILIEQFRPGVMNRLGLGCEVLQALNPKLVYASITGFGQAGPRAQEAGHDITYQARAGLISLALDPAATTALPPPLIADIAAGAMQAVTQILLGLRAAERTGLGAHLDISMTGGLSPFLWHQLAEIEADLAPSGGGNGLLTGGSPRYRLYRTSDGRHLAVGAIEEKFWAVFCEQIGLEDALRANAAPASEVIAAVAVLIAGKPADHWRATLETADCCCAIVATVEEAMAAGDLTDWR
ncbi:MAG: CaiB/BaiF CoA transferase family protein [Bosea sp. (in: a-proteobacteria)]